MRRKNDPTTWREFYCRLSFVHVPTLEGLVTEPLCQMKFVNTRMIKRDGEIDDEMYGREPIVQARVLDLTLGRQYADVGLTLTGELPAGIKRGTYTLRFTADSTCSELPSTMFEEGHVPSEVFRQD